MPSVLDRLFGAKEPTVDAGASGGSATASAAALAALKPEAGKTRRRPSKSEVAEQALADADKQAALDELFENENWEVIASMYFEIRFAMTGFEYFRLTEKQQRVLGKSMGACMKLLLAIDPKWVALIVFSANFGAYATDKELAYRRALKDLEARQGSTNGRQG